MGKKSKKSKGKKSSPVAVFFKNAARFIRQKKLIFSAGLAVLVIFAAGITLGVRRAKSAEQQNLTVGFYGLSEKVSKALEQEIQKIGAEKLTFKTLAASELENEKSLKSLDLVFMQDGLLADRIKQKSSSIPSRLYAYLPTSLRRENEPNDRKSIPLLLDHFEFSYNKNVASKIGKENPQSFAQLQDFLQASKKYTFTPFFTNGGDDEILLGLVSALIEAQGGYDAYSEFVGLLKKQPSFEKLLEQKLGKSELTLQTVLDLLRSWQEDGIVHPAWYKAKFRDIIAFMEDGQISVVFTRLSLHRTIPYKLIRDFSTERAPVLSNSQDHAIIAPPICAIKISKKSINDKLLQSLLAEEGQSSLSMVSQLAPVALRGESYDIQADDVRFFAASCRYGARTDAASAAFMPESEARENFCAAIRRYLAAERL